jgi:hypothetical protein
VGGLATGSHGPGPDRLLLQHVVARGGAEKPLQQLVPYFRQNIARDYSYDEFIIGLLFLEFSVSDMLVGLRKPSCKAQTLLQMSPELIQYLLATTPEDISIF